MLEKSFYLTLFILSISFDDGNFYENAKFFWFSSSLNMNFYFLRPFFPPLPSPPLPSPYLINPLFSLVQNPRDNPQDVLDGFTRVLRIFGYGLPYLAVFGLAEGAFIDYVLLFFL